MSPRRSLVALSLGLLVGMAVTLFWSWRAARAPVPLLEPIPPAALPMPEEAGGRNDLKQALASSLHYLRSRPAGEALPWGDGQVTAGLLCRTLEGFSGLLDQDLSPARWQEELSRRFTVYRLSSERGRWPFTTRRGGPAEKKKPILITGYFQPTLRASQEQTAEFPYPLYGVPQDLIRIVLPDFADELPRRTLWGRVRDGRLVPYYTRAEIDFGNALAGAQVLAWLASPVDGLLVHIQGSGVLIFPDEVRRYVHFAGCNGYPYQSIGRWLIEQGLLKQQEADWPGIRRWAETHPERLREALATNQRYVFFRWEDRGPIGNLGEVLTPYRSIALDQTIYPPGALCLIKTTIPGPEANGPQQLRNAFVLNQDVGSAIRGPRRLDLYCGEGDAAGRVAGRLKARGEVFFLLLKEG